MSDRPLESFLPSEGLYQEEQAQSYLSKAGNFLGIKIDMNKPGDTYLNLNEFFHGKVGDNGSASYVPFVFCSWDRVIENATVSISGKYPSGNGFLLKPPTNSDQSVVHNIEFNTGFLREAGRYRFNFILTLSDGSQITSKDCFFDVEQNMINIAFNFANGVGPFDSEYEEWKAQVEKDMSDVREQVATTQKTLSDIKGIAQGYESDVSGYAEKAWNDKLNEENTWTGQQHFNGGLTASTVGGNMLEGSNLSIDSSASLPANTTFGGKFNAMDTFRYVSASDNVTLLNATAEAQGSSKYWIWAERYESHSDSNNFPHFFYYFALKIDCNDAGKPIAQFPKGFFSGANSGPISISVGSGTIGVYPKADDDCLYLQYATGLSGQITLATKIWS